MRSIQLLTLLSLLWVLKEFIPAVLGREEVSALDESPVYHERGSHRDNQPSTPRIHTYGQF